MDQYRRPGRKRRNSNQNLKILIAILAVILVVMVIIALVTRDGGKTDNPNTTTGSSVPGVPEDSTPAPQGLTVTFPTERTFVWLEENLRFQGTAQPGETVTVGATAVTVGADGSFVVDVKLVPGTNEIPVTYHGETVTYRAVYRQVIQSYFPSEDITYNSGATVQVEVFAREGSQLTVKIGTQTVRMTADPNQVGSGIAEGFVRYTGTYKLPTGNTEDQIVGQFTFTAVYNGITESFTSGTVTCKKVPELLSSDPSVTPDYGDYMDVGSGYIVEIINYNAETFNGHTTDDNSDPRNSYLPKGTVDYCKVDPIKANSTEYMLMRCGRRVYVKSNNWPDRGKVRVVDCYRGSLPDHNEIGFVGFTQSGHHTVLTLNTLWKAPFYFDLKPQEYLDVSDRDFRVTQLTAEYVDITFCYASVFEGTVSVPADNPLFASAELIRRDADCTLRLHLKKVGGFYGWDAYYNEQNQLCFRFLNAVRAAATGSNPYGADLTGIRIMLDVGHGGIDSGAYVKLPDGSEVHEDTLNLNLAMALKGKLESMGATVIMNRTADVNLNVHERIQFLLQQAPDLCIAIHQDSAPSYPNTSGAHMMYFTPFSQKIGQLIYEETAATGVYKPGRVFLEWSVYFVSRQTVCPVVLTENGYMTNATDFPNMTNSASVDAKAEAMAKAVAAYFLQNG